MINTHVVALASIITIFGANADKTKPIGIAVVSHFNAVSQNTLQRHKYSKNNGRHQPVVIHIVWTVPTI